MNFVKIQVVNADALTFKADVLALKFAQSHYGIDRAVARALAVVHANDLAMPRVGDVSLYSTQGSISADKVLFLGVETLDQFGYVQIRDFGRRVLQSLAGVGGAIAHVAMTIHGAGYGLDEAEAFRAELAGVIDALSVNGFPSGLKTISFVERDARLAKRLDGVLGALIPSGKIELGKALHAISLGTEADVLLQSVGVGSASKPRVFVAMPFAAEMNDLFHYGIQGAVKSVKTADSNELLCERADLSSFTGDVMSWVKERISTARIVIADLSMSNPNVFLEVGYAWGVGVPTILLANEKKALELFDVQGQRCLIYDNSIQRLEALLTKELQALV